MEFSLGKMKHPNVDDTGDALVRPGSDGEEGAIVLEVRWKAFENKRAKQGLARCATSLRCSVVL